jgi:hypothetical protein
VDFARVDLVGQALADEVFRVWKSHHPGTILRIVNASPDVQFMITRASAQARPGSPYAGHQPPILHSAFRTLFTVVCMPVLRKALPEAHRRFVEDLPV